MNAPAIQTLSITEIKPYFRNPRENKEAVQKVKQSIQKYGYNQLIAVDLEHIIVVGHTRHKALAELGWQQVPVMVLDLTPAQAKAYRIADNKAAEFAKWSPDLATELRELGDSLPDLQSFFTEDLGAMLAGSVGSVANAETVSQAQVEGTQDRLDGRFQQKKSKPPMELTCEHCGKQFYVSK